MYGQPKLDIVGIVFFGIYIYQKIRSIYIYIYNEEV